ncbi:MAG: hypothetical protein PUP93_09960 [Rhizonema sp. NSF051]|nr:hypothetical protein [Rhizonema sp. NSF051]
MPSVQTQKTFHYPRGTVDRAERALMCSPFNLNLFEAMRSHHVALSEITGNSGVKYGYTRSALSELRTDNSLMWLIQVGVLRREVDGQGITDSFRLTPLGYQLVQKFQFSAWRTPSWSDRSVDAVIHWLRLPF